MDNKMNIHSHFYIKKKDKEKMNNILLNKSSRKILMSPIKQPTIQSINQSINQSNNQSVNRSIIPPINYSINQSTIFKLLLDL